MTANRNERCDIEIEPGRTVKLVPEPNEKQLNEKQLVDYREHRWKFVQWLLEKGKNPKKREGYSPYSVYGTAYRTARFDRWAWQHEGRYTFPPRSEKATEYMDENVAYRDVTTATKGKTEEALMRFYRWIAETTHADEWDREQRFRSGGNDAPRDYLTRRERRLVRETALDTGDGWRVTSIVLTSLDAGLRPVEVARAKPEWVDVDNMLLRIPKEDSSKNEDNWRVSLTSRTATALDHWLQERGEDSMYDDRDELWLTREATAYGSRSLSRLLSRLCEDAGIDEAGRSLTWYAVRHSLGTLMTAERDLKATKDQLRHKSAKTSMKYDQVSPSARRNALDNM
jgi:integrase